VRRGPGLPAAARGPAAEEETFMKAWVTVLVLCALPAAAEEQTTLSKGETAKSMIAEVKLGPYTPLIDRSLPLKPYNSTFGSAPMLLGEIEVEYEFFQALGSASVGVSVGYAEKYGKALTDTGATSSETTGIVIEPLKALLSYRFDYLSLHYHVPLVPYAKAAFVMIPFTITKGGQVEVYDGLRAAGVKYGFAGTLGLGLTLDFLDQRLARDFDSSMGVNHTYLFGEFAFQEVTDFGTMKSTDLDFSSRHFIFGLALEF
jgi:hypothetical protein